jgi:hypothetical protein
MGYSLTDSRREEYVYLNATLVIFYALLNIESMPQVMLTRKWCWWHHSIDSMPPQRSCKHAQIQYSADFQVLT